MQQLIRRQVLERLHCSRGPADDGFLDLRILSQPEVQPAIVLRRKSAAAGDLLHLLLAVPEQRNLGANGAAVALCAFEVEFDPVISGCDGVFVNQQWATLVGDHRIEDAAVPQIGQRDRAAIVGVGHADSLGNIFKFAGAVVDPDFLLLIAREAAAVEGGQFVASLMIVLLPPATLEKSYQ